MCVCKRDGDRERERERTRERLCVYVVLWAVGARPRVSLKGSIDGYMSRLKEQGKDDRIELGVVTNCVCVCVFVCV